MTPFGPASDTEGPVLLAGMGNPPDSRAWLREALGPEAEIDVLPADGRGISALDPGRHACVLVWQGPWSPGGARMARAVRCEPHLRWMPVVGVAARGDPRHAPALLDAPVDDLIWEDDPAPVVALRLRTTLSTRDPGDRALEAPSPPSVTLEEEGLSLESVEAELLALREIAALARLSDRMSHELRGRVAVVSAAADALASGYLRAGRLLPEVAARMAAGDAPGYAALLEEVLEAEPQPYSPARGAARAASARRWEGAWGGGARDAARARELVDARLPPEVEARVGAARSLGTAPQDLLVTLAAGRAASHRMAEATAALRRAVEQLRSFSLEVGPVEGLDVHEGLETTLSLMAYDLAPALRVERSFGPDVPRVRANPAELNAVWTHLVEEAAAAVGGRGTLVLRTRGDRLRGRRAARVDLEAAPASAGPSAGPRPGRDPSRSRVAERVCADLLSRCGGELRTGPQDPRRAWNVLIPAQET